MNMHTVVARSAFAAIALIGSGSAMAGVEITCKTVHVQGDELACELPVKNAGFDQSWDDTFYGSNLKDWTVTDDPQMRGNKQETYAKFPYFGNWLRQMVPVSGSASGDVTPATFQLRFDSGHKGGQSGMEAYMRLLTPTGALIKDASVSYEATETRGKILRMTTDGAVPQGARLEIGFRRIDHGPGSAAIDNVHVQQWFAPAR